MPKVLYEMSRPLLAMVSLLVPAVGIGASPVVECRCYAILFPDPDVFNFPRTWP